MSLQCGVTCLDCRISAPEVGDGGLLGAPVLDVREDCESAVFGDEPIPSFGYFFEVLEDFGLRPYDVERFREFLVAHAGHRMYTASDVDDPAKWPDELRELERQDHDIGEQLDRLAAEQAAREASGEFVQACYRIECTTCGDAHESETPELLKMLPPRAIDTAAVARFLERMPGLEEYSHRLFGVLDWCDPFFEGLFEFLTDHARHDLRAQLVPAAAADDED